MKRRWFTPFRIALSLGLALAGGRFGELRYLSLADMRLMDFRLIQRGAVEPGPEVVVIAIDNSAISNIGRWPWPRSIVARLIDNLTAAEPAVIGFDIVFSEPSAFDERPNLSAQPAIINDEDWRATQHALEAQDVMLRESLRNSQRAVLGYFFDLDAGSVSGVPEPPDTYSLVRGTADGSGEKHVRNATALVSNLPGYEVAARAMGFFNEQPESDGYVRRLPMVITFGEEEDMALPLELAILRLYDPSRMTSIHFDKSGVDSIQWGDRSIPVDQSGKLLINYRGPGRTFPHISAADLLEGHIAPERLRGKIALLGVTAVAVGDVRVTPFDQNFPGVEIHATAMDNILRGDFVYSPTWLVLVDCGIVLGLALVLGIAMKRMRGVPAALLAVALLGAYLMISQQVFVRFGLPLSLAYPMLTIVVIYSGIAVEQYVGEEREKRKVRRALELYLSPSMASVVSAQPDQLKLGGEKREMTVLFTDIRGFTSISEGLEPEALVELLNEYLGEMTEIVFAHDGMLDKYIGDAVMALWGAPLAQPDQAERACRAALAMVERLGTLNQEFEARGWQRLKIGGGINTGPMAFGNMGSTSHLSLTVMGDNVNLASRIEHLTKTYGTSLIITENTYRGARDAVIARELDFVRVRGKQDHVRIFELLGPIAERERWEWLAEQSVAGLAAYRARNWERALQTFSDILKRRPEDEPARLFCRRCEEMAAAVLPEDWDGVTVGD